MITARLRRAPRPAFTLLEVILALSIGVVLLGALYFVLSAQVRLTQAGRDLLDDSTITRAVFTRISQDIQSTLAPHDFRVLPDYAAPPTEETTDGSTTDSGTTDSGSTDSGSTDSGTTTDGGTTASEPMKTTTTTVRNTVDFNIGVEGGEDYLILTVGKAQRLDGDASPAESSGLRRILYWIVPGEKGGLARYEIKNATGDEVKMMPADVPDPENKVIAPEVLGLAFEYFDGTGFSSSWRGSDPAGDLNNPIGPPSAIRVSLQIRKSGAQPTPDGEARTIQMQHVIAIPTGNHFPQGDS